jgi:hypothetical protein
MADERMYLGRPGSLASIRSPRGVVQADRQRRVSTFELGVGGYAVDQMIGGARTYTINYEQLTRADAAVLQAYADGHEGPGPFAFLDPGQRNMLTVNMSGATSQTNDTTNFSVAGSGTTIASSTAYTDAGPRVLALTFAHGFPGASAAVTPDWPSTIFPYGVPVVAGRSLCFSVYVRGGGTDAIVTYTPQIIYRNAAGAVVATTSGSATASASDAWTRIHAAAVPPADGIWADWKIAYTSGVSAGSIGYFRRFQLEEGSTPGDWLPGTGVWPVRVGALPDAWPFLAPDLRAGPTVTLIEDVT